MTQLANSVGIPTMSYESINKADEMENAIFKCPQLDIETSHVLHGGIYTRTIYLPKGALISGVLIKIDTVLTLSGHLGICLGDKTVEYNGYHVLPAGAYRKQIILALNDSHMTMSFATNASTVEQAEEEFTDEAHNLASRQQPTIIERSEKCQE